MQKYISKNTNSYSGKGSIDNISKKVNRFSGNAKRLEHSNVRNKNKSKKGN